jgi:TonB family protein
MVLAQIRASDGKKAVYVNPPYPKLGYEAIEKELRYPDIIRKAGKEGNVLLEVFVGATGKVNSVEIVDGFHPELDRIAKGAVSSVAWIPAKSNGKSVSSKIKIPIIFSLVDDTSSSKKFNEDEIPTFKGSPVVITAEPPIVIDF